MVPRLARSFTTEKKLTTFYDRIHVYVHGYNFVIILPKLHILLSLLLMLVEIGSRSFSYIHFFSKDNLMANKLVYIPNDETQNYPYCSVKWLKRLNT